MVYALTWLPGVLEAAGLKVAEVDGWRSRGRAEMGRVRGVILHHTAGAKTGNMPSLDLLVKGRPDLSGPLAQLGLGRDGTYYVLAAGRANHAGAGRWREVETGNSSFIGIEAENTGTAQDPWPAVQMDAYRRGVAAILKHVGADADLCCGHREYALPRGRKSDPVFDMDDFRDAVRAIMTGRVAPPAPIPASDGRSRPTLRRGAEGDLVRLVQTKLGLSADGRFGPGTEAAVRAFQRSHDLVPDGIIGPKGWAALDALGSAPAPVPAPAAPAIKPIDTTPPVPAPPLAPAQPAAPAAALPPADDDTHGVSVQGTKAVGPDGTVFARVFRQGFFTTGETSLARWLADPATAANGLSASAVRVVRAMCVNEGGLEAVNSYDACFMSFGIFQWTAGQDGEAGELPALLARFKAASPAAYTECFGRFGLEPQAAAGATTGRLVLAGKVLASAADKAPLRGPKWAYRFWRAGHHPALRQAELAFAASRLARFQDAAVEGHRLRDWLSSEYGMALALDEHVNRPGHVPGTLDTALKALFAGAGAPGRDPAAWGDAQEEALIDAYVEARGHTNMTDSSARAGRIGECVRTGQLGDGRGSFG